MLDPDTSKDYLDRVQNRSKEKKYAYDVAFGAEAKNVVMHSLPKCLLLLHCTTLIGFSFLLLPRWVLYTCLGL